jgi:uncharacterized protein (TIGR00369 family)
MTPPTFEPRDPAFEARVRDDFARQGAMRSFGARLVRVGPGCVQIEQEGAAGLTQQDGFLHGGVVSAVMDTACGFAALTLMAPGAGVLTVEFKVNFVAPARTAGLRAVGQVLKSGRTLTLVEGQAHEQAEDGSWRLLATMSATMMAVVPRA